MEKSVALLMSVIPTIAGLMGCSTANGSPERTVRDYLEASFDGNVAAACQRTVDPDSDPPSPATPETCSSGARSWADYGKMVFGSKPIIKVLGAAVDRDTASVSDEQILINGTAVSEIDPDNSPITLAKVNGRWLISDLG